jgi:Domain of unknown function (DU1801).
MTSISVQAWLANLAPGIRAITKQLRAVARKNMPGADECIYHDAIGYSVSDSPANRICYIAPQKKGYVNFGFFFGVGLPDPKHLLIGEGKRLRHVKVWNVEEAKNPALAKLIAATWKKAPESVAKVYAERKKSKAQII